MKKNFLLITGGTGGHVIPAKNFANYLSFKDINCTIITDKRDIIFICGMPRSGTTITRKIFLNKEDTAGFSEFNHFNKLKEFCNGSLVNQKEKNKEAFNQITPTVKRLIFKEPGLNINLNKIVTEIKFKTLSFVIVIRRYEDILTSYLVRYLDKGDRWKKNQDEFINDIFIYFDQIEQILRNKKSNVNAHFIGYDYTYRNKDNFIDTCKKFEIMSSTKARKYFDAKINFNEHKNSESKLEIIDKIYHSKKIKSYSNDTQKLILLGFSKTNFKPINI